MTLIPRLPIRAFAASVLAVAGVALAPGGAAASCGDYVHVVTDHPPASPHGPAAPCPGCSKAPAPPAIPLTAPVGSPSESEQSVALTSLAGGARPVPGWRRWTTASPQPVLLTSSIFHPPRAA